MFRRRLMVLLIAVFAALFFLPAFSSLVTDWWCFREIGYQIIFTGELTARLLLFLAVGGLTAGVFCLNLRAAQRGLVPYPVGTGPRTQPAPTVATRAALSDSGFRTLVAEAPRRYEAALQAQRDIDWARDEEEFRRLGELIERLGNGRSEQQH